MNYQELFSLTAVYAGLIGTVFMFTHLGIFALTGYTTKVLNVITIISFLFLLLLWFLNIQDLIPISMQSYI